MIVWRLLFYKDSASMILHGQRKVIPRPGLIRTDVAPTVSKAQKAALIAVQSAALIVVAEQFGIDR
jgi:hypothetical protein